MDPQACFELWRTSSGQEKKQAMQDYNDWVDGGGFPAIYGGREVIGLSTTRILF